MATLPDPDFTCDESNPQNCKFVAGVRPYRTDTFRLELVNIGGKHLVHNYGHGGAGITMSWGCTDVVRSIVTATVPTSKTIGIVGAGVMGLTAATLLRQAGYPIAIYADKFTDTTSDVAGGQWAPSVVEYRAHVPSEKDRFEDILRVAYRTHKANGASFGVSRRTNYTVRLSPSFAKVPTDIIPAPTRLAHLPFAKLNRPGYAYDTLLVEPPIFLARLRSDLRADPSVSWHKKVLQSQSDVLGLPESCIVNCSGLGAKKLFNDSNMVPIKGQLALVKPQPQLQYLYSTGETYVFPRADHVVVGGSYEEGVSDDTPDPVKCRKILQMARKAFEGVLTRSDERESWMMRDK